MYNDERLDKNAFFFYYMAESEKSMDIKLNNLFEILKRLEKLEEKLDNLEEIIENA